MTDMIERVARAICADMGYAWDDQAETAIGRHGNDPRLPARCDFLDAARVALAAARVPTRAMIAAANRNNHPRDIDTWQTMIDVALGETP